LQIEQSEVEKLAFRVAYVLFVTPHQPKEIQMSTDLEKLRKQLSELMARSCSAMFDQEVWSKADHRILTNTLDKVRAHIDKEIENE
jgi:hypothetical protein